ncbi:mpv17-like protein 2 [Drosophila grimshawi]|uniref:GH24495 n=1 Tax=Drosophila grimshawi TaxID=7222 RepID=B4JLQ1_DROGR|nr:mpv17-like protein 2 [Drosophila grimshawi]EDV91662.1 GH24495 [Drosophila grimshawi]
MHFLRRKLRTLLSLGSRSIRRKVANSTGSGAKADVRTGMVQKMREWHTNAFSNKFLLFTNVGISLTLSSVGDILEQQLELYNEEIDEYSSTRTQHMATSGVAVGIICHYWYQLLDKYLPGRSMRVVAKKIVLDQFICSPLYISAFFVTLGILEQKDAQEVWTEIREKAWKLYAAEWTVWPVAQFINFYWIPTHYRIFYDNVISLGYDVFTSKVKHAQSHLPIAAAVASSSAASAAAAKNLKTQHI